MAEASGVPDTLSRRAFLRLGMLGVTSMAVLSCQPAAPSPTAPPAVKPTEAAKPPAPAGSPAASPAASPSPLASPSPAAAAPVRKPAGPEVTLKVGYIPLTDFAGMYAAIENGYFREVGLNLDLQVMQGGATIIPALEGGSLEVGISNALSIVLAHDQGLEPLIVVDSAYEATDSPAHSIVARGDSTITTGKDLEGKKYAVNTLRNIEHLMIIKWIEKGGGDPNRVQFLELPFPQMIPAVQNGQVDAAGEVEPFVTAAKDQGLKVIANHYVEIQPRTLVAPLVSKRSWVEANKETVQRFAEAVKRGNAWAMDRANNAETRQIVIKYARLDPALGAKINLTPLGTRTEPSLLQWWIDEARKLGWVQKDLRAEAMIYDTAR
jgi:NitT/TauT family transport system substrate-binding protein